MGHLTAIRFPLYPGFIPVTAIGQETTSRPQTACCKALGRKYLRVRLQPLMRTAPMTQAPGGKAVELMAKVLGGKATEELMAKVLGGKVTEELTAKVLGGKATELMAKATELMAKMLGGKATELMAKAMELMAKVLGAKAMELMAKAPGAKDILRPLQATQLTAQVLGAEMGLVRPLWAPWAWLHPQL